MLENTDPGYKTLTNEEFWIEKENCYISKIPQGDPRWKDIKIGKPSMSLAYEILGKSSYGTEYEAYLKVIGESFSFPTSDMLRGIKDEPLVRKWYEKNFGYDVTEIGIALLKENPKIGASSDGLVGNEGMIEIKCPRKYNPEDDIKPEYYYQIQGNFLVLGEERKWCDLIVKCQNNVYIRRVYPDISVMTEIKTGFEKFIVKYGL